MQPSSVLSSVRGPADLKRLGPAALATLAGEIRDFLVRSVARTGGHLGPNLGVIELTIALHRVFDSPRDTLIWDTGHQAYVHKLLTGRRAAFPGLRSANGLSGYPNRTESRCDLVENSTHPPPCPTPTAWRRRTPCAAGPTGRSSPSSATGR